MQIQNKNWLVVGNTALKEQKSTLGNLANTQVLWSFGKTLDWDLVNMLAPEVAIISSPKSDTASFSKLRADKTEVFWTARDGAIQWTGDRKFEPTVEAPENNAALL